MNELVKVVNNEIEVSHEAVKKIAALTQVKKELENMEKDFKSQLLEAMIECGIKSIRNDYFTATYFEENTSTRFDSDKAKEFIKEQGRKVSEFEKEVKTKDYVKLYPKKRKTND